MKQLTEEIKNKLELSHIGLQKFSWHELYDTEDELIQDMFNEKVCTTGLNRCKGYVYIDSFRKYYNTHNMLTQKQLRQLKRLAYEIAYMVYIRE